MLKNLMRKAINACGYEVRKIQPPAEGTNWIADLNRLNRAVHNPIVFDVGANIGNVSRRLAVAFPAPARIFAFEPATATFAQLNASVASFRHVQCHHLALSETPGRLRLYHGANSELNRLKTTGTGAGETYEEVDVSTLDEISSRIGIDRIDLLKTDTEGFDASVLRGGIGLLRRGAIRTVVTEATFDPTSDLHTRFDELRDLLVPYGFCVYGIYECERWGVHLKYCNVAFVREADFATIPTAYA